jgi:protease-4
MHDLYIYNIVHEFVFMKTSKVLTEILRHAWMMDLRAVNGFLPVVATWLRGEELMFEDRGAFQIKAATASAFSPDDIESLQDAPDNTVAIIPIRREMTKYGGMSHYGTVEIAGLMKIASRLNNITGVVLDVDSPGGSVNSIPPLVEAIKVLQAQGKPVVVHGDLVASAALFVSVYADWIMVDNKLSSEFGSIGVMVEFADFKEYFESQGVKIHTVYADQSKDKNAEFREALKGNYDPLKKHILNPLAEMFQDAVKNTRGKKLLVAEPGLLSGGLFTGEDAVRVGLADGMGTLTDAVSMVFSLTEVKKFMRR